MQTRRRTAGAIASILVALIGVARSGAQEPKPVPPAQGAAGATERPADQPAAPEGPPPVELSLRDTIRMSVERNLDAQVARLDPEQRRQDLIVAEAVFAPTVFGDISRAKQNRQATTFLSLLGGTSSVNDTFDAGIRKEFATGGVATLFWNNNRFAKQPLFAGDLNPSYSSDLSLSFTQPLLRGFGATSARTNIVVTRNNLLVSGSQVRGTVQTNVRDATNAYWDLAAAISNLDVARQALQLAGNLLKLNRAKVEVGTLAPIEITQAEAGVASREEAVIVAENSIRTAEDALRRIMNPPKDSDLWTRPIRPKDPPPFEPIQPEMKQEIDAALQNRPELEQQRLRVRNLELQVVIDQNAVRPQLDLAGSYGLSGAGGDISVGVDDNGDGTVDRLVKLQDQGFSDAFDQIKDRNQVSWSVGLHASYPLGNRAAKAALARSRVATEQGRLSLANAEQGVEIEVRNAVRQVQTNVKRVQAARSNLELQRKKLEAEQKRFQYGMTTSFEVLSFQNDLTAAQSAEISAVIDYNKSLANLANATGTLLEKQGIVVE